MSAPIFVLDYEYKLCPSNMLCFRDEPPLVWPSGQWFVYPDISVSWKDALASKAAPQAPNTTGTGCTACPVTLSSSLSHASQGSDAFQVRFTLAGLRPTFNAEQAFTPFCTGSATALFQPPHPATPHLTDFACGVSQPSLMQRFLIAF